MQTILGAGGAIGKILAKELNQYTSSVRLVGRNPEKVNETDELMPGDITDPDVVLKAVEGSEVVYIVAGLKYDIKVWREQWPIIIQNTIKACERFNVKLVFFDNVYIYDSESLGDIREENPERPSSKKGKVRKQIAEMIMQEVKEGKLTAMIVRAADFYGPGVRTSMIMETVYKNFKKGKKANWLGNVNKIHSLTYTPDAAKATALLGNTSDAYNQVWHLPTDTQKLTGKEWIGLFSKEMNVRPRYTNLSSGFIKFMGLFNPFMRELGEMLYQFDRDYFFNSSKFNRRFPEFKTTPYQEGVKEVVTES
jgi:nucleoside-diphosphate-sugar epimerase